VFERSDYSPPAIETDEYQSPRLIDVKLLFAPQMAFRVYEEFSAESVKKTDGGYLAVNVSMPDDFWLLSYVLSFGECAEVIEPEHLRHKLYRLAENIKNKYIN
jgi:predicted DNA-binding transcriptional regulator YafY